MAFKIQKYKTHGHILNEVLFHFSWLLCGFFFLWGSICEMWLEYLVLWAKSFAFKRKIRLFCKSLVSYLLCYWWYPLFWVMILRYWCNNCAVKGTIVFPYFWPRELLPGSCVLCVFIFKHRSHFLVALNLTKVGIGVPYYCLIFSQMIAFYYRKNIPNIGFYKHW